MQMLQRIEQALEYAATCVAKHGEAYLPLFERLEAELQAAQAKENALDRARRLAQRN